MLMLIRLIIMLEVSKPQKGLELVPVGIRNSRNVSYKPSLVIRSVANKSYMPSKCLLYLSGVAGWVGLTVILRLISAKLD